MEEIRIVDLEQFRSLPTDEEIIMMTNNQSGISKKLFLNEIPNNGIEFFTSGRAGSDQEMFFKSKCPIDCNTAAVEIYRYTKNNTTRWYGNSERSVRTIKKWRKIFDKGHMDTDKIYLSYKVWPYDSITFEDPSVGYVSYDNSEGQLQAVRIMIDRIDDETDYSVINQEFSYRYKIVFGADIYQNTSAGLVFRGRTSFSYIDTFVKLLMGQRNLYIDGDDAYFYFKWGRSSFNLHFKYSEIPAGGGVHLVKMLPFKLEVNGVFTDFKANVHLSYDRNRNFAENNIKVVVS